VRSAEFGVRNEDTIFNLHSEFRNERGLVLETLRIEHRPDGVAVLMLDQPGSRANVLTPALWADLGAALQQLATQPGVKGLVIASAKPGVFVAGADLKLLQNASGPNDPAVAMFIGQGLRVLELLEQLPFATCAAIDGAAVGGGLEVALACDCRVVGSNPKVRLSLPETNLGLIPGWGGTQRLPRIVGMVEAAQMLFSGEPCPPTSALIDKATSSEALLDTAAAMAADSLNRGRRQQKFQPVLFAERNAFTLGTTLVSPAQREAIRVMVAGAELPLSAGIQLETTAFLNLAGGEDSKQRIAGFFAGKSR
jgi:enoyl-CoA hydratase